jgi:hypothetical protein
MKENVSGGAYISRTGEIINAYKTLLRKGDCKNQYMKIRHRFDNLVILKSVSREMDVDSVNLI